MFLFAVRTYIRSIETNGYALDLVFATMFSRHGLTLAISDFILVLSTGLCVPFVKAVQKGYIKYYWTGLVLQHLWQLGVLVIAVKWTFNRFVKFICGEDTSWGLGLIDGAFVGIGRGSSPGT